MAEHCFLDTNILLYAIGEVPEEAEKRIRARKIVLEEACAISVQVCQEFINQATSPKRRFKFSFEEAEQRLRGFRHLSIQDNTLAVFDFAMIIATRTNYSIWDSLIVAAAQAQSCTILYTEDMQHGHIIDGLRIINPFREGALVR